MCQTSCDRPVATPAAVASAAEAGLPCLRCLLMALHVSLPGILQVVRRVASALVELRSLLALCVNLACILYIVQRIAKVLVKLRPALLHPPPKLRAQRPAGHGREAIVPAGQA